jgi:hypothetical protein
MSKLFNKIIPYWNHLSFGDKCFELAMVGIMGVCGVTFVILVGGLITVTVLSFFEEPVQAPIVQQSKAEQFASDLATELAKKDLSVKIIVMRD